MNYFLDTSVLIDFLNQKERAIDCIKKVMESEESRLFINRLVYIETLRTIPWQHTKVFLATKKALESFEKLDITQAIYEKAILFSRYCLMRGVQLKKGKSGDCQPIDFLHFMTAKEYGLALVTFDKDFEKLEKLYSEFVGVVE